MFTYLIPEDIYLINEMSIQQHSGNFIPPQNLLRPDAIEYVVEAVKMTVFGESAYPEIHHKAGLYMFNIISNHIFSDGNKRTGLEAALLFRKTNNYKLIENLKTIDGLLIPNYTRQQILTHFTLSVATSDIDLIQVQNWFKANIEKRVDPSATSYAMSA